MDLFPDSNVRRSLGSSTLCWNDISLKDLKFDDTTTQSTAVIPYTAGIGISISGTTITNTAAGANSVLSNPTSPTAVNQSLVPGADSADNLGSKTLRWNAVYASSGYYLGKTLTLYSPAGFNFFVGRSAGNTTLAGTNNTAVGTQTMQNVTAGSNNTGIGFSALISNSTGNYNTAIGTDALLTNITGNNNTATGSYSLVSNTTGIYNLAEGSDALHNNTSGNYNTANGDGKLMDTKQMVLAK